MVLRVFLLALGPAAAAPVSLEALSNVVGVPSVGEVVSFCAGVPSVSAWATSFLAGVASFSTGVAPASLLTEMASFMPAGLLVSVEDVTFSVGSLSIHQQTTEYQFGHSLEGAISDEVVLLNTFGL